MKRTRLLLMLLVALFAWRTGVHAQSGCTNASQYGSASAPATGLTNTFSTCSYAGEYSPLSGVVANQLYQCNINLVGGYITVRSGTVAGTVVAAGPTPLTWRAPVGGTYYIHWNLGSACGSQFSCFTTTVTGLSSGGCTNSVQYTSFTPSCPSVSPQAFAGCTYAGEYNLLTLTGGNTYAFTSSVTTDIITITDGVNTVLASAVQPVTFTPSVSGTYRVHFHLAGCGTASACRNPAVQCYTTGPPPNPCDAIAITTNPVSNQAVVCHPANLISGIACGTAGTLYMGGNEALYTYTPATTGSYTISYAGQTYVGIYVFSGACPTSGGSCVSSASAGFSSTVSHTVTMTAGITYWIMFDTWPSPPSPCPGTFSISAPAPPPLPGQCTNTIAYGSTTFPTPGQTSTIFCQYASEYGTWSGAVAGATYTASSTIGTDWLTVRSGTPGGPVVAYGAQPLTFTATVAGTYYIHCNVNSLCATATGCRDISVFRACPSIGATAAVVDNCGAGTFNVNITVTDLGGAASGNVVYSIDGGPNQTIPNVTTSATIPNVPYTSEVSVSVNNGLAGCTPLALGVFDSNCPITIQCSQPAISITYCYKNNDTKNWTFIPSAPGESITVTFISGTMMNGVVRTYSGLNNLGTPLAIQGNYPNLANATAQSLPGQPLYMEVENLSGDGSCQSGDATVWVFEVRCTPPCDDPLGTATLLPADCTTNTFQISVEVEYTGATLGSENPTTTASWTVNGAPGGTVTGLSAFDVVTIPTTGGFPLGAEVTVQLLNTGNPLCNRTLATDLTVPASTCFPDDPCLATLIPVGTSCVNQLITTVGATNTTTVPPPTCAFYNNGPDVWYKVVVPANGVIYAKTASGGTIFDSGMAFYTGASCNGPLTQIACNDDDFAQTGGNWSYLTATGLTPGSTLFIRLWRYAGGTGTMNFCVWTDPPCSPNATSTGATNITQTTASLTFTPPPVSQAPGCVWVLRLTDTFGDGWNGALLNLRQGTTVLQTVGSTFTTGTGPVDVPVSVPLTAGTTYNLSWQAGGSFPGECGFQLLYNGVSQYSFGPNAAITTGTTLYSFTPSCNNIPSPASVIVEWGPAATFTTPGTGATAGPGGTVVNTTSSPVNLTGLTANTQYRYFVRRNCSAAGNGYAANTPLPNGTLFNTLPPPPANDNCAGALTVPVNPGLTCTLVTPATLAGATSSQPAAPCGGTANDDVWFTFTMTNANHQVFLGSVSPFTTLYSQYFVGGACGSLINIGCATATTVNIVGGVPGTVITFRVYSLGSVPVLSNFTACVRTLPDAPPNDLCQNAIQISCNSKTTGTTLNSFTVGAPATCITTLNTAGGVWYKVQGWNGSMTATTCNTNSNYDTKLGVFTGSCGAFTCVTGNDDNCGLPGLGLRSTVTWAANQNTQYYIYVTGFSTATGNFELEVKCNSTSPACADNGLQLEVQTDNNGAQVSWQILKLSNSYVVCSGQNLASNTTVFANCCLPDDCYDLRVYDSGGDGIVDGGYALRTQFTGNRIIDNSFNFNALFNGSLSTVSDNQGFCLPIGTDKLVDGGIL